MHPSEIQDGSQYPEQSLGRQYYRHAHPRQVRCQRDNQQREWFLHHVPPQSRCYQDLEVWLRSLAVVNCPVDAVQYSVHLKHRERLLSLSQFELRGEYAGLHRLRETWWSDRGWDNPIPHQEEIAIWLRFPVKPDRLFVLFCDRVGDFGGDLGKCQGELRQTQWCCSHQSEPRGILALVVSLHKLNRLVRRDNFLTSVFAIHLLQHIAAPASRVHLHSACNIPQRDRDRANLV